MKRINDYSKFVTRTYLRPKRKSVDPNLAVIGFGLGGECGEVLEILKKYVRDGKYSRAHLKKELGDVAYYWARICHKFGFEPADVLAANVAKIRGRVKRGTRRGSGDNR